MPSDCANSWAWRHQLPKTIDRHALQQLLRSVRGRPESFAINLSVLKSLTRAEYSPKRLGHFALASEHYAHFTSPIRRYADLTVHRLLDAWFEQSSAGFKHGPLPHPRGKHERTKLEGVPSERDLIEIGRHISYTERRSEDAENELRKVKLLTLLQGHVGEEYTGVVTGITNFGLFVQLQRWLIDGLIRYEDLMDDWWDVDERAGVVRGQRTGKKIGIGDVVRVIIAAVDVPRRELDLTIIEVMKKAGHPDPKVGVQPKRPGKKKPASKKHEHRGGGSRRNMKSKRRGKGK